MSTIKAQSTVAVSRSNTSVKLIHVPISCSQKHTALCLNCSPIYFTTCDNTKLYRQTNGQNNASKLKSIQQPFILCELWQYICELLCHEHYMYLGDALTNLRWWTKNTWSSVANASQLHLCKKDMVNFPLVFFEDSISTFLFKKPVFV